MLARSTSTKNGETRGEGGREFAAAVTLKNGLFRTGLAIAQAGEGILRLYY